MRKEIANFFYSSEAAENDDTEREQEAPEPDIPVLATEPEPEKPDLTSSMLNQ